jgi:hypothetical protein
MLGSTPQYVRSPPRFRRCGRWQHAPVKAPAISRFALATVELQSLPTRDAWRFEFQIWFCRRECFFSLRPYPLACVQPPRGVRTPQLGHPRLIRAAAARAGYFGKPVVMLCVGVRVGSPRYFPEKPICIHSFIGLYVPCTGDNLFKTLPIFMHSPKDSCIKTILLLQCMQISTPPSPHLHPRSQQTKKINQTLPPPNHPPPPPAPSLLLCGGDDAGPSEAPLLEKRRDGRVKVLQGCVQFLAVHAHVAVFVLRCNAEE